MDKNLTYIAILLDRSGSMRGSESDVVGGVNTFLDEQRKVPGEALVTIARFDTEFETIMEDVRLKDARNIVPSDFVPRGNTALCDALNRLIAHIGAKLASMPEEKRPHQVHFLTFSDGEENQSQEVTREAVVKLVKHQETKYAWKFLFFGMGIDGLAVGGSVGIKGMSSSKTSGGILRSAKAASAYVGTSRQGRHDLADQIYGSNHVADQGVTRGIEEFEKSLKDRVASAESDEDGA